MSKILITGSSDGLGFLTAKRLISGGHQVVLHARNEKRKDEVLEKLPDTEVLIADLNLLDETKDLANKVNGLGTFDAVIHNAGVNRTDSQTIFNVNVLAPYVLTSLIKMPKRLIYLSSGMHQGGKPLLKPEDPSEISYSDSKLLVNLIANAVARKNPEVYSNSVNPGWVPTKMGGNSAPDDLTKGIETQIWLATSEDNEAKVSGKYFFHQKQEKPNHDADNIELQETLLKKNMR